MDSMKEKLGDLRKNSKAQDNPKPSTEPANPYTIDDAGEFAKNMVRVGQQSQRLLTDFFKRQSAASKEPLDPLNIAGPFMALIKAMSANPSAIVDAQFQLWKDFLGLWEITARKMMGGEAEPVVAPRAGRQTLQGQGLAGKPDLRLHQAVLPADRELDAGHGRQGRRPR